MINRGLIVALLVSTSVAFAQLDSNSVTVTASRSLSLQPDQVVFSIDVTSGLNASLDDVIAAVQGAGITAANFSSLNSTLPGGVIQPQPSALQWAFALPVPLSKMKDTTAALTSLQQGLVKKNNGFALSFSVQGVQVSTQLQQSQTCSIADLLSDARTQAQS